MYVNEHGSARRPSTSTRGKIVMTNTSSQQWPSVSRQLVCSACDTTLSFREMVTACPTCGGRLRYALSGRYRWPDRDVSPLSLWRYADLLPLGSRQHVVSMGEGASEIVELDELRDALHGARLFLKLDSQRNPTGTFKDREASLIISRCVELGLDGLVFYSTGNTGRAYMHYAAAAGLTTYLFVPAECQYKQTASIGKTPANHLIAIDAEYPRIAPYAKQFAATNGLTLIAPLHDRTEAYTTLAYEQVEQLPECDFFAQTIASGMGPIGFLRGHEHLVNLGVSTRSRIPRILCIQSSETNIMSRAYQAGAETLTPADLPDSWPARLFEPTLNSTNPVNNYPELRDCLRDSHGAITDVDPACVTAESGRLIRALSTRGIDLAFDIERSVLIGYAGLVRLASEGQFTPGDRVLLLATGRGIHSARGPILEPDLVIRPSLDDPADVFTRLTLTRV
jgi:threonine synthase